MADMADAAVIVPSRNTQRIQEVHVLLVHILSALVESAVSIDRDSGTTRRPAAVPREAHQ